jgi:hypothetical protein
VGSWSCNSFGNLFYHPPALFLPQLSEKEMRPHRFCSLLFSPLLFFLLRSEKAEKLQFFLCPKGRKQAMMYRDYTNLIDR